MQGVVFRPADKRKRVAGRGAMGGWDQVRARLDGDADGRPRCCCCSARRAIWIRTLPALPQHDDARPEDVDSDMEIMLRTRVDISGVCRGHSCAIWRRNRPGTRGARGMRRSSEPTAAWTVAQAGAPTQSRMFEQRAINKATAEHNRLLRPDVRLYPLKPNPLMQPPEAP